MRLMQPTSSIREAQSPGTPADLVNHAERRVNGESYEQLIHRLSVQSVRKHYRAFEDIAWDAPEMQIDPADPRFELGPDEGLGRTEWYRALPQETRARIGLSGIVGAMKLGVIFENVLKRGLLEFAADLPNRSEEFRYVYHEVIEEAHHSLMFQELINRSGQNPSPMPRALQRGTRYVVRMARVFPELFFFFVLGGEEPIDFAQKQTIKSGRTLHPLVKRIMQIHITEEARHLCFARNYLQRTVPQLSAFKKLRLRVALPVLLGIMAKMMLQPSSAMIRRYEIPSSVIREAYDDNPEHKRKVRASLASVAKLAIELELLRPRDVWLWRRQGLGNPFKYAV
jgi:hypothetical protein